MNDIARGGGGGQERGCMRGSGGDPPRTPSQPFSSHWHFSLQGMPWGSESQFLNVHTVGEHSGVCLWDGTEPHSGPGVGTSHGLQRPGEERGCQPANR